MCDYLIGEAFVIITTRSRWIDQVVPEDEKRNERNGKVTHRCIGALQGTNTLSHRLAVDFEREESEHAVVL